MPMAMAMFGGPMTNHTKNYVNLDGDYPGTLSTVFDPWISRDLKAGMNYGPSGFAPIPIGFGGSSYQSAYDQNGLFTGAWQFVGVYGGNALFSTPEEISGYKSYRNTIKGAVDGKSWTNSQLTFIGAPFALTHGIRPTSTFVAGRSCTDCHSTSPLVPLFSGSFDMLGTAIKATTQGGAFMQSPATQFTTVGNANDIATGAESSSKIGYSFEIPFEQLCDWNPTTKTCTADAGGSYKQVVPLDRATILYPFAGDGSDGLSFTYTDGNGSHNKYTDVNGNSYSTRTDWVNYLTNATAITTAAQTIQSTHPVPIVTAPESPINY